MLRLAMAAADPGSTAAHPGRVPTVSILCCWRGAPVQKGSPQTAAQLREEKEGRAESQQASSYSSSCDA